MDYLDLMVGSLLTFLFFYWQKLRLVCLPLKMKKYNKIQGGKWVHGCLVTSKFSYLGFRLIAFEPKFSDSVLKKYLRGLNAANLIGADFN